MKISERGAIRSAIADGGYSLYPAGRLIDIIKSSLEGDNLQGDFNPQTTVEKFDKVIGPEDITSREIFEQDISLLKDRLSKIKPEYDIEPIFNKFVETLPELAKRYYSIDDFEPVKAFVVEYYFEGHSDLYKDGDWNAFNINSIESREMGVPVGIYFKRNQVSPGYPELTVLHESNHAMQERAAVPPGYHHYIPWFDEGLADIFGKMMLYRATENESILSKLQNFRSDIDICDPRKVTYMYGEETAALILIRGRLPFTKAMMRVRQREPFSIDWNSFANMIKSGIDPHIAILKAYTGSKLETFRKKFDKDERTFRGDADLDQRDLRILSMALATQSPACLNPKEYKAALWIAYEAQENRKKHSVDPEVIPQNLRDKIPGWQRDALIPADKIPNEVWEKAPELSVKIQIRETDVPSELKESVDALAVKFFIIRRQIGDAVVFEPYGGGLPYRLGTGEIRCTYL